MTPELTETFRARICAPLGDAQRVPEKSVCRDDKRSDLAIS